MQSWGKQHEQTEDVKAAQCGQINFQKDTSRKMTWNEEALSKWTLH